VPEKPKVFITIVKPKQMLASNSNHQPQEIDFGKRVCPFYLYVMWKPGVRKTGDSKSTYNGDKWVSDGNLGKMIINLLRIFEKDYSKMNYALLYDNRIPRFHPERHIVVLKNGFIETNELRRYEIILEPLGYPLPPMLKYK
jgi:hypothetical protein